MPISHTWDESRNGRGLASTASAVRRRTLLRIAGLHALLERTPGDVTTRIALIDGPVITDAGLEAQPIPIERDGQARSSLRARAHATHIASIFGGRPPDLLGLCPRATMVSVAVVDDAMLDGTLSPDAIGAELAEAVAAAVGADADVILLGIAVAGAGSGVFAPLHREIATAAGRGIRTVMPVGNDGGPGSPLLDVPGAVPVAFGDDAMRLDARNRWSPALAHSGIVAPGVAIPGLDGNGDVVFGTGSSFAAAIVTATYALLRACVPDVPREAIWAAMRQPTPGLARRGLPQPLDGEASYIRLARSHRAEGGTDHGRSAWGAMELAG